MNGRYLPVTFYQQPTEHSHATMDMFTNEEMQMAICVRCCEFFPDEREDSGFDRCIPCNTQYAKARGEQIKKQSAPVNKSNYMYISNAEFVKQLNPKRTT